MAEVEANIELDADPSASMRSRTDFKVLEERGRKALLLKLYAFIMDVSKLLDERFTLEELDEISRLIL